MKKELKRFCNYLFDIGVLSGFNPNEFDELYKGYKNLYNSAQRENSNVSDNEQKEKVLLDKYCDCGRLYYYHPYCGICDNDE